MNAAAFTDMDAAESDSRETAKRVNDYGVKVICQVCAERKIPLCHISTNHIFAGYQRREYSINDEPKPANFYAMTKLRGERHVRKLPRHLIIRTSWLFGGPNSFVVKILKQAKEEEIPVVADQFSRPTFAEDLAQAIEGLIDAGVVGTCHFANEGWCSLAEFAEQILEMIGSEAKVQHVPSDFFPVVANQPKFSVLQLNELPSLVNRHWQFSLAEHLRELGYYVGKGR